MVIPPRAPSAAERSPLFLQGREVAVINIFTGFVGVVIALILLIQAAVQNNLASARGGGFILLFAFTYLWVAFNQVITGSGRAFGWYCLFVAITAIPAGIYTLQTAGGNPAECGWGSTGSPGPFCGRCSSCCWRWSGRSHCSSGG